MNTNSFLSKQNVELLWGVVTEEDLIKDQDKTTLDELRNLFVSNLKPFYDTRKNETNSLMEMNRNYIALLENHIRRHYKLTPTRKGINQFEKDLTMKQNEFTNSMAKPIPPTPNFTDPLDTPISEMELELKRIQEQRNYDIEQVNKNLQTNMKQNKSSPSSWLKSQETSVKTEKMNYIKISDREENSSILKNDVIDLNKPEKSISWPDEMDSITKISVPQQHRNEVLSTNINEIDSIFKKLKKIPDAPLPPILKDASTTKDSNVNIKLEEKIDQLSQKVDQILEILSSMK